MVNLDNLRTKLDHKLVDEEEVLYALIATLEALDDLAAGNTVVSVEAVEEVLLDNLDGYVDEPETCAHETYRATLETPAEGCENYAMQDSDYCSEHSE